MSAPDEVGQPGSDVHVHPNALVESAAVGAGSRVWAFAHILPGAVIGTDANICDHVFVEGDVVVGDRVTIKSGVQLWDGLRVEDDVFIGPNATFTNDPMPRSKQYLERYPTTTLRRGCSIGANAVVLPGVTVGASALVGAGAVVTHDVPPFAIVYGNPARIRGYVDAARQPGETAGEDAGGATHPIDRFAAVRLIPMPVISDLRGRLSFGEIEQQLPFAPKRYFVVFDVPSEEVRGEHAHRELAQLLVCIKGALSVVVDDGVNRAEIRLDTPERALYLPPMVWSIQYRYSPDAVLLVLASERYDGDDYIRDYDEFQSAVAGE
jgi:UDP-2-acetamido-3-amino-2,3-dideoxy-glucuronate N-acetyltransferase